MLRAMAGYWIGSCALVFALLAKGKERKGRERWLGSTYCLYDVVLAMSTDNVQVGVLAILWGGVQR